MRKIATAAAVGASLCVTMLALAADPQDLQPEARAYLNFSFDGSRQDSRAFFYGLRIDRDRYAPDQLHPAVAQLEFSSAGTAKASLNGLPFMRSVRLAQSEDMGEASATGETTETTETTETAETTETTETTETSDYGDSSDSGDTGESGGETQYSFADWGMVIVGLVGIGFVVAEVADTEESPDPAPGTTGGTAGGSTTGTPPCVPGPPPLCLPVSGGNGTLNDSRVDREYQQWLDGGTGQMGDLVAH